MVFAVYRHFCLKIQIEELVQSAKRKLNQINHTYNRMHWTYFSILPSDAWSILAYCISFSCKDDESSLTGNNKKR